MTRDSSDLQCGSSSSSHAGSFTVLLSLQLLPDVDTVLHTFIIPARLRSVVARMRRHGRCNEASIVEV